jgi:hypothetical protein
MAGRPHPGYRLVAHAQWRCDRCSLSIARDVPTATLLDDGRFLDAGGEASSPDVNNGELPSAELYQP